MLGNRPAQNSGLSGLVREYQPEVAPSVVTVFTSVLLALAG
jgi:hypothetical protein